MASKTDFDPPPKYEEVIEMGDTGNGDKYTPSAPLLPVDFRSASTIKIVKAETKREYGPYKFFIQDSNTDTRFFQGEVNFKKCVSITGIDETPFIEITAILAGDSRFVKDDEYKKFEQFSISRKDIPLGVLVVGPDWKMTFITDQGLKPYKFQIAEGKETEMQISRSEPEVKLAGITGPEKKGYEPFECTIEFSDKIDEPLLEDEKELIATFAATFLSCRNGPIFTKGEHMFWAGLGYLIGIGILVAIIVGVVYLFKYLFDNCNRPGYRCGSRRY